MVYSKEQLDYVRALAYKYTGITLGINKDAMISNRLDKLKRILGYENLEQLFCEINKGEHLDTFVNSITTNKTHFFREGFHFDDLRDRIALQAIDRGESLNVYCSAASTGEEPYSIVMTLEYAKELYGNQFFDYSLVASDIDTSALAKSKEGIYEWQKSVGDFPAWIQPAKYFQRRKKSPKLDDYLIKIKSSLRNKVKFGKMNLTSDRYPFNEGVFDVVFCRNVLIYFNVEDQNVILKKLFATLKVGGTLYLGHAESPLGLTPYVERLGHNIFVKKMEHQ